MDAKENKFLNFLIDCITAGNDIIKGFFKIKIVNKDNAPDILITLSDDKNELQILMLQLNFVMEGYEGMNQFIKQFIKDEEASEAFKAVLYKTIYTLLEACKEKLELNKTETKGETN